MEGKRQRKAPKKLDFFPKNQVRATGRAQSAKGKTPNTITVRVAKQYEHEEIGVALQDEVLDIATGEEMIKVVSVEKGGLFDGSQLKAGMVISEVNGIQCKNARAAKYLLRHASVGSIRVKAKLSPPAPAASAQDGVEMESVDRPPVDRPPSTPPPANK